VATVLLARIFASSTIGHIDELVLVRGWVFRLRTLAMRKRKKTDKARS